MTDWMIQVLVRQHQEQLLEEARRERLAHTAPSPRWKRNWWKALAVHWMPNGIARAAQLATCEPCVERKAITFGQAI